MTRRNSRTVVTGTGDKSIPARVRQGDARASRWACAQPYEALACERKRQKEWIESTTSVTQINTSRRESEQLSLLHVKNNEKLKKKWSRAIIVVIAVIVTSAESDSKLASSILHIALLTQGNPVSNLELGMVVCICLVFVQGVSKLNDERGRTTAQNSFRSRVHLWK
ncbi:hypothetical protein CBL_13948 [Carabus blaptoides fortunei]